jgi:hypothetical protein
MALDLDTDPRSVAVRARAKAAYERGRLRDGALAGSFAVPLALAVGVVEQHVLGCFVVGVALAMVIAALHWRGRDLGRGIVPGVVAGVVPLALALVSMKTHFCIGGSCASACIAACSAGGVVAGVFSAWFARRSALPRAAWVSAGSVALLVGALGCLCVGVFGVLGLVAGLLVGSVPIVLRPALSR